MYSFVEIPDSKSYKKRDNNQNDWENTATVFILFHFLKLFVFKVNRNHSSILITADFVFELHAEKYPSAPFEIFEIGFAGAAEPGLVFTSS